jgi:DNA gyrase/topoisomerase IV subunit A
MITLTSLGVVKHTPRHLDQRQRRAGMGVFDLDTPESDPPAILVAADESQSILLFTDQARAFRLPVLLFPAEPVRGRGQSLALKLGLFPMRALAAPARWPKAQSPCQRRGIVRYLRHRLWRI